MKHIHILGICGTFMGGVAMIAKQMGYKVTGSDTNVYPPMSTFLQEQGIEIIPNYDVCLLYTSDADDDLTRVAICGRASIKKK